LEGFTCKQGCRNSANAWADISLNVVETVVNDVRGLSTVSSHVSVLEDSLLEAINVLEGFILDGDSAASDGPESIALLVGHSPSDGNSCVVTSQGGQNVLGLVWNSSRLDLEISGGLRVTNSVKGLAGKDVRNAISNTSDGGLSSGEGSVRGDIISSDCDLVHEVVVEIVVEIDVVVREVLIVSDPVSTDRGTTIERTRVALDGKSLTAS
jgi:hypothetical protein